MCAEPATAESTQSQKEGEGLQAHLRLLQTQTSAGLKFSSWRHFHKAKQLSAPSAAGCAGRGQGQPHALAGETQRWKRNHPSPARTERRNSPSYIKLKAEWNHSVLLCLLLSIAGDVYTDK